ncbi:MAG: HAMP domain-containing protein, partial [Gallionella sp.]
MKKILNEFLHKLTLERQLGILVTFGILLFALSSALVGAWQSDDRARLRLIEQGQRITENLARQSALALIYGSVDNADAAVNATLSFPGVVSVEIIDINQHSLVSRGGITPAEFPQAGAHIDWNNAEAILDVENANAWRFVAPVYTRPAAKSPFDMQPAAPELLGQVVVVMSKAVLAQARKDIFISNLITSFSFALLFLFLIRFLTRRMTRPLTQLSASMERATAGETEVRAILSGPKDIADMAYAFNSMM